MTEEPNITKAVQLLHRGDLVAFPTETVYGLGADAKNPIAVRRIFALKGRPVNHPLIVHVQNLDQAEEWAVFDDRAREIAKKYWPGPLALILPKQPTVPDEVTGGLSTIGVRCPSHPVAQRLLSAFGSGIAAPSANRFGRISPTKANHVRSEFNSDLFVLDGGNSTIGIESTIVDLCGLRPAILRPGYITSDDINQHWGPLGVSDRVAPGTLKAHYAPKTSLLLSRNPEEDCRKLQEKGLIVAVLSAKTANEYAHMLYDELRRLDESNVDILIAEMAEETGVGIAVNDRLTRAATGAPTHIHEMNNQTKEK